MIFRQVALDRSHEIAGRDGVLEGGNGCIQVRIRLGLGVIDAPRDDRDGVEADRRPRRVFEAPAGVDGDRDDVLDAVDILERRKRRETEGLLHGRTVVERGRRDAIHDGGQRQRRLER